LSKFFCYKTVKITQPQVSGRAPLTILRKWGANTAIITQTSQDFWTVLRTKFLDDNY